MASKRDMRTWKDRIKKNPNYREYHNKWKRDWRKQNPEKAKERDRKMEIIHPLKRHIKSLARKFSLGLECELCPEDDKRVEQLEKHHPSYDGGMEGIFVTTCRECHYYADRSIEVAQ